MRESFTREKSNRIFGESDENKCKTVNMEIKKALRDSIILPTLTFASETWTWNEDQRSRIQAAEMSYLIDIYGLNRMNSESNESLYGKFGVSVKSEGMNCGVVEMVKHRTLR